MNAPTGRNASVTTVTTGHFRIGLVELAPDGGQAHHHQEEIEGVQGPAQESRQNGGPMVARARPAAGLILRMGHVQAILTYRRGERVKQPAPEAGPTFGQSISGGRWYD